MTRLVLALLALAALPASGQPSAQTRTMTPDLLWSLHRVAGPAVSPDGRTVAFVAYRGADLSRGTLHVVALAGGAPRPIDVGVRTVTDVAFSADGRHLYVLGADAYRRSNMPAGDYAHDIDLYAVGTDGRGLRRLTTLDASVMEDLAVVRAGERGSGERVVVKLGPEPGDSGDYVFLDPARPGPPAPVWTAHPDSFWVMSAAVSPDGRRVAFDDRNVAGWSLMDIATQQVRPLTLPGGSPATVRWTHRSDALVVCQTCDEPSPALARVDPATGAATAVQIRLADVLAAQDAAP